MFAVHHTTWLVAALWAAAGAIAQGQALWLEQTERPSPDARDAIALLQGAAAEGLDARDYPVPPPDSPEFDDALASSTLRYLHDLRFGRVDPRALGFDVPSRDNVDLALLLRDAAGDHRIRGLAMELSPPIPMYAELRHELARYRALAEATRPQATDDVRAFLVALGDLSPDAAPDTGSLRIAVQRFQRRHGLEPDGVVGPATRKALLIPLAWRVRQIELTMERLRWMPRFPPQRILAVNIPMFRVWGMGSASVPPFSSEVIVGRALKTHTPLLLEQMEYVIFRPYWNIPSSILRGEILPSLRRSPEYLQRNEMEIVAGESDTARVVPVTEESIAGLRAGTLRLRQRPGPQNSLGLVKFVFPNDVNVYMHGTPAQALFARARRDFSHGCIRVADPVGLAEWVLSGQPDWPRDRIAAAMNGTSSIRVQLARPIPVILFYTTAMPIDGIMHFAEDIYGHDVRLDRYLAAGRNHRPSTE